MEWGSSRFWFYVNRCIFREDMRQKRFSHFRHSDLYLSQEAQLSQRDRATLRDIEYFAKTLEVIRNGDVE